MRKQSQTNDSGKTIIISIVLEWGGGGGGREGGNWVINLISP